MTTQAQPIGSGPAAEEPGSISKAKLALIGTIVGALITAAPAIINALNDGDVQSVVPTAAAQAPAPTVVARSKLGSIDDVTTDGSDIIVTGSAADDVSSVVVVIPRPSDGDQQYWVARAEVQDRHWQAVIETDTPLPSRVKTTAHYHLRPTAQAFAGLSFRQDPPTPPPAPAEDAVNCAVVHGDACFTGPGWGQASVSETVR